LSFSGMPPRRSGSKVLWTVSQRVLNEAETAGDLVSAEVM
jgi:hypothetical protein